MSLLLNLRAKRELHPDCVPPPRGYRRWWDDRCTGGINCIWLPTPLYHLTKLKNSFMLWFYRNLHAPWYRFCKRRGWIQ